MSILTEENSTIDQTYRWGSNLPNYDGKSVTVLNIPCFKTSYETEDEIIFSSKVANRTDVIIKLALIRAKELGKMHILVGWTEFDMPNWY